MNQLEKKDLQLGYIPLLDCTAILWAQHQGYFDQQGLNVTLVKEASWASLRDRMAFGLLDVTHCLSAMLPAAATGDDHLGIPLQTSQVLSTTRAFISLSQQLCYELNISPADTPTDSARKITQAMQQGKKIQLAHVFKQSIHHYCLREWLALGNTEFAQNYRLSTLPPPYMVEAIVARLIDGFCVGEPWNIQAQIQGYSQIIAESRQIIPEVADKVLATTQEWAVQHPNTLSAVKKAIQQAQHDLTHLDRLDDVWKMLEASEIICFHCSDHLHVESFYKIQTIIRSFGVQKVPQVDHFKWIVQQMSKWEHLELSTAEVEQIAQQCVGIAIE